MILWWIMNYGGMWHKKKLQVVCSNRRICGEEGRRVYVCVCVCVYVYALSGIRLCAIPWTVAHQAPLSMRFSRQEYWSG